MITIFHNPNKIDDSSEELWTERKRKIFVCLGVTFILLGFIFLMSILWIVLQEGENQGLKYCKDFMVKSDVSKKRESDSSKNLRRRKRETYANIRIQHCHSFNAGCMIIYANILNIANKWLQMNSDTNYPLYVVNENIKGFISELREWQKDKYPAIKFCVLCEEIKRSSKGLPIYFNIMPKSYLNKGIPIPIPDDFNYENNL